jgi:hypothetical protein
MKKIVQGLIANPGQGRRRELRLMVETVRLLSPEALAQAISGCDTGSNPTQASVRSVGC